MAAIEGGYAIYVLAVAASLLAQGETAEAPRLSLGWGRNINTESPEGRDGILILDWISGHDIAGGLSPGLSAGIAPSGMAYMSLDLRKTFRFGPVNLSPHIGPALYGSGGFDASELVQVRTGFEIEWRLSDQADLRVGTWHMSNAQITDGSADLDVVEIGLSLQF
jgi:hypothetical protein